MGKYNYTGKTVYIGIDVHKKTYACVSVCEGEVMKKDTMPADPTALINCALTASMRDFLIEN